MAAPARGDEAGWVASSGLAGRVLAAPDEGERWSRPSWWPVEGLAFGGDWNPGDWPREVWTHDIALMRRLGVNLVSLPVFGWSRLEPRRGHYELDWLAQILQALDEADIRACLATGTATPPAWLVRAHPEVLPVGPDGVRYDFGSRQTYCPSSVVFRDGARRLAAAMADRFGDHPALAVWHVSNEYGDHVARCYCDTCAGAFREWLRARHGSIEALNDAWTTRVWGQTYGDFNQITPPRRTTAPGNPAHLLDFERFGSDTVLDLFAAEVAVLREATPSVPVTTNFMGILRDLDYWRFAAIEDIVSDDAYPDPVDPESPAAIALTYGLMRSLKRRPWLLLESAPGAVSWRDVNVPKAPGQHRAHTLQALAHGSDAAMVFQWRAARAGAERFHSAIVGHRGEASRSFAEATALAADLAALAPIAGSIVRSSVAMIVDWDAIWALHPGASLPRTDLDWHGPARGWHAALRSWGLAVDCVRGTDDLARYPVIVAPSLYLVGEATAARLIEYVAAGGSLVVGPFAAVVDPDERVHAGGAPGPLRRLLGVEVDEQWPLTGREGVGVAFASGATAVPQGWAEWIEPYDGVRVIGSYTGGALAGRPAITVNNYGAGHAYYLSASLDAAALASLLGEACAQAGVGLRGTPDGDVEVVTRTNGAEDFVFVINHGSADATVSVPEGAEFLLGGPADAPGALVLAPFGAAVLRLPCPDPSLLHIQRIEVRHGE